MVDGTCPIWGTPAEILPKTGDSDVYDSPRAGGKFKISRTVQVVMANDPLTPQQRARLTTWLVDQRSAGLDCPSIGANVIDQIRNSRNLTFKEKLTRFFIYYDKLNLRLDERISVKTNNHYYNGMCNSVEIIYEDELHHFMSLLVEMNYFSYEHIIPVGEYSITATGYHKLDEVLANNIDSNQVFVAQWFGGAAFKEEMDKVFEAGMLKGIEGCDMGLKAFRIDQKEHNGKICDEIIAEIRRSKLVVADFTCDSATPAPGEPTEAIVGGDKADDERIPLIRGGVYYEAGFAHGLGIPVIFTCRIDCTKAIHFDTQQYNHILWKDEADLAQKLKQRIRATFNPN